MTYQNRARKLLGDVAAIGLVGGALIWVICIFALGRGGEMHEIAAAVAWMTVAQIMLAVGAASLLGYTVARSVAYDIRNAHLPEYEPRRIASEKRDIDWYE